MASITFYDDVINHMLKHPGGMVGRWMDKKGSRLVALAKAQVGVDTGALRSSISHQTTGQSYGIRVRVSATDKKAMMHHEGTRAHFIHPRRAQVLRFKHNGRIVYAKQVWHPGTKPNKFLTDNLPKVL